MTVINNFTQTKEIQITTSISSLHFLTFLLQYFFIIALFFCEQSNFTQILSNTVPPPNTINSARNTT